MFWPLVINLCTVGLMQCIPVEICVMLIKLRACWVVQGCSDEGFQKLLTICPEAWQILARVEIYLFISLYITLFYTTCHT